VSETITKPRSALLSAGKLSARSGTHVETIRYFERIGLIPEAERTANGHRRFSASHLQQLNFIRRAKEMGFSQEEVRSLIELSNDQDKSCAEVKAIADAHLAIIRSKIAGLLRLEKLLADAAAQCGESKRPHCPVIEALQEE
jgi:MerR family transcriptional regulator, mercuric resistance operon regulatory protein